MSGRRSCGGADIEVPSGLGGRIGSVDVPIDLKPNSIRSETTSRLAYGDTAVRGRVLGVSADLLGLTAGRFTHDIVIMAR